MRRRLLSLALLILLLDPVALLTRAWLPSDSSCRDHPCLCVRRCPPDRILLPCHGERREGPGMQGACSHDQTVVVGSTTPAILPLGARLASLVRVASAVPERAGVLSAGFDRIEPPPPWTASS